MHLLPSFNKASSLKVEAISFHNIKITFNFKNILKTILLCNNFTGNRLLILH